MYRCPLLEQARPHEELESGSEPPYESAERQLLQATDFSPEIVPLAEKPKSPRYFELRIYHSPTERQLRQVPHTTWPSPLTRSPTATSRT